jgi:hypothetical protein
MRCEAWERGGRWNELNQLRGDLQAKHCGDVRSHNPRPGHLCECGVLDHFATGSQSAGAFPLRGKFQRKVLSRATGSGFTQISVVEVSAVPWKVVQDPVPPAGRIVIVTDTPSEQVHHLQSGCDA